MKIETDIPIPPGRCPPKSYSFNKMEEGHSVVVPFNEAVAFRQAATYYKVRHPGWDYTTRKEVDGLRLWCTSLPDAQD
jgi:hypothetical protein